MERYMYPWMCTHVLICYLLSVYFLLLFVMILFLTKTWCNFCYMYMYILWEYWELNYAVLLMLQRGQKMRIIAFEWSLSSLNILWHFLVLFCMCVVVLSAISKSVLWNWEANHLSLSSQTVTWTELWDRSECIIWASMSLNCGSKIKRLDTWSFVCS